MFEPRCWLALAFLVAAGAWQARAQQSAVDFSRIDARLDQAADRAAIDANHASEKTIQPAENSTATVTKSLEAPMNPRLDSMAAAVLPILARKQLPAGLAAVVAVESGGNPFALSPKGARGLWQLMPATARRYGLVVNLQTDERLDPVRATEAAAQYLKDLYAQFGSWPLALAAYNWGEQNLSAAIDRTRVADFASLVAARALPAETRAYVPAVLARWPASRLPSSNSPVAPLTFAVQSPFPSATPNGN